MENHNIFINEVPAILWGQQSNRLFLYIHGKGGNKEEAAAFSEIVCQRGFQVLSIDLPEHGQRKSEINTFNPWHAVPELKMIMEYAKKHWQNISLFANSIGALVKMCFSGKYSEKEVYKKLVGNGGFNAYLGTNDVRNVTQRVNDGDEEAKMALDAFHYQVAKDIGSMACVLEGKVDKIILTGGIAYNKVTCEALQKMCGWIADFVIYPGEDELLALAQGALRVLKGEEEACIY